MPRRLRNCTMAFSLLIVPAWAHAQTSPPDSTRVDIVRFVPPTPDSIVDIQAVPLIDTAVNDTSALGPATPEPKVTTEVKPIAVDTPAQVQVRGLELVLRSMRAKTADIRFFGAKALNSSEGGGGISLGVHVRNTWRIGGDFSWLSPSGGKGFGSFTVSVTHSRHIGKQWSASVAGYAGPTFSSQDGDKPVVGLSSNVCLYIPNSLPNEQHGALGFFVEPFFQSRGMIGVRLGFMRAQPH